MMVAGVSETSTRPACIRLMRSHHSASFMKWVETKIVTPSLRESSARMRQKSSRATGSTPEVGSSRIRMSGAWIIATASDSRWRMPSGSASGRLSIMSVRSNRSAISRIRSGMRSGAILNSRACRSRFCATVNSEYSENAWLM